MAGHAERYALCTVDYKGRGHSNPVIRSFIASYEQPFFIKGRLFNGLPYFYIFSTGKTALDVLKVFLKVFFSSDKEHRREKKVLP